MKKAAFLEEKPPGAHHILLLTQFLMLFVRGNRNALFGRSFRFVRLNR